MLETDLAIPDPLVSFMRLLLSSEDDWTKLRDKGKLPKPRTDKDVLNMVVAVLQERQADYLTTLAVRHLTSFSMEIFSTEHRLHAG